MTRRPLHILVLTFCLALAGCAIPVDTAPSVDGTVREYFWQPGLGEIHYDVYNGLNTTPVDHTITFTSQGDTLHAIDQSNGLTGRISSRVYPSTVHLIDVQSTALFPLPEGAYISAYSSEQTKKQYLPVSEFMYFEGGAVAFSGEWPYYTSDGTTWTKSITPISGTVTATCALTSAKLYAGTSAGKLYLSEDGGKKWNLIKSVEKPIITIVKDEATIFFAVAEIGVYSVKGANFARVGKDLPTIAGIACVRSDGGDLIILAATQDKGLLRVMPGGNDLWGELPSTIDDKLMTGVYAQHANVLVTMKNGDYYTSADAAKTWVRGLTDVTAAAARFTAGTVAFERGSMATSNGWILTTGLNAQAAQRVTSIGNEIHAIHQPQADQWIVASDLGLMRVKTSGAPEQIGPFVEVPDSARGEFALLQSLAGGPLKPGDSWHAGNLYIPQSQIGTKYFQITARVIEQLDSLSVDNSSFGDVFVVRYSLEINGEPAPLSPYWMIYFSRNIGPVMIDRIQDHSTLTSPVSRAVYRGRK